MFNVADLRARVILSMGLDLGWRIGDFVKIKKAMLPDLNQPTPIPFELITEKEQVISKSFLSAETVELLKTYMPTLPKENPYLFPSNHSKFLDPETVNDILKGLVKKVGLKIPEGKRLRFHSFRKRFLSTCADLKVDVNTAKILVGKDVESSMLAYLSEVNHKQAFLEVKEVLNLSNGRIKQTVEAKDVEIAKLRKELEEMKLVLKGFTEMFGEDIARKTIEKLKQEGKLTTLPIKTQQELEYGKIADAYELLLALAKAREQEQQAEYQKLVESNNGNNNH
jgi:hypothetical protein